jgi:Kef-type K+ transport system membrane component KefB
VGLIFANIGAGLMIAGHPVIRSSTFSAVVIMVIITTMVTPPVLKITLERGDRKKAQHAEARAEPPGVS